MTLTLHRIEGIGPAHCALWRVDLDAPASADLRAALSPDERARASRFAFDRDRGRYIAAHAALRQILVALTGLPGDRLAFTAGRFGKPALVAPHAPLHFNLSHSDGTALIAVSTAQEIGVDVEVPRPLADAQALADVHFTADEGRALAALPPAARGRALRVCWTRKEACLKALGVGLQLESRSFEVGVTAASRPVVIATPEGPEHLMLYSFALDDDAVGAVAFRQTAPALAGRHWPDTEGVAA